MMRELGIKQPRLVQRDRRILLQDNAGRYVDRITLLKLQRLDLETLDFIITRSLGFFGANINKLLLRWQNCVDCSGAYLD